MRVPRTLAQPQVFLRRVPPFRPRAFAQPRALGAAQRRWAKATAGVPRASTNRAFFSGKLCHQHLAAGPLLRVY